MTCKTFVSFLWKSNYIIRKHKYAKYKILYIESYILNNIIIIVYITEKIRVNKFLQNTS